MARSVGGRPREGEQVKSAPIGIRTDQELRDRLIEEAARNRVSLTREIERRLRDSFEAEAIPLPPSLQKAIDESAAALGVSPLEEIKERLMLSLNQDGFFGSSKTARLLRRIGVAIELIEEETGADWHNDMAAFQAVERAIRDMMRTYPGSRRSRDEPDIVETQKQAIIAGKKYRDAVKRFEESMGKVPDLSEYTAALHKFRKGDLDKSYLDALGAKLDPELFRDFYHQLTDANLLGRDYEEKQQRSDEAMRPFRDAARIADRVGRLGAMVALGLVERDAKSEVATEPGTEHQAQVDDDETEDEETPGGS